MDMSGRARGRGGIGPFPSGGRGHGDDRSEISSEAGSSSVDTTGRAAKRKSEGKVFVIKRALHGYLIGVNCKDLLKPNA